MESWIGSLLALIMGVVFIALGYPLSGKRIGPNDFYGLRIPQTRKNPDIWYPVNARFGKHVMITGGVLVLLGAISQLLGETGNHQNIVMFLAIVLALAGTLYSGIAGYFMARSMAAQTPS